MPSIDSERPDDLFSELTFNNPKALLSVRNKRLFLCFEENLQESGIGFAISNLVVNLNRLNNGNDKIPEDIFRAITTHISDKIDEEKSIILATAILSDQLSENKVSLHSLSQVSDTSHYQKF